mgnify:CR=1 FL=1|tara:strand:+ start:8529 stop:9410 length:882 start_codon:yes stop_codon:yes gene_type:complete
MSITSTVTIPLDVMSKYNALVKESLGSDSAYIRAKETVEELVAKGSIDDATKAATLSNILSSALNSVTSASMSTALEWAKYEKELALKKLEIDRQLLILDKEAELKDAQILQIEVQRKSTQVESRRMFGIGTFDVSSGALLNLTEEGKVWNDMLLTTQQITNAGIEETLLESKIKESTVAIHKVVADTYTNFGTFGFTFGIDGAITTIARLDPANVTLSDTQQQIAVEQGKGYTYNAWANALTGSASILGTALASGDFDFSPGSSGDTLMQTVIGCASNLRIANSTTAEAIPT